MPRYYVVTPQYESGGDEIDPPEVGADVIEIEAPTKREAIRMGVIGMLNFDRRRWRWCRDQRSDGHNPFAGVKAIEVQPEPVEA